MEFEGCEWLTNMLATTGSQGLGVVAFRDGDYRRFVVQARPFTEWQLKELGALGKEHGELMGRLNRDEQGRALGIKVMMELPLQYCPHCGMDLLKAIRRQQAAFDGLAEAHRTFLLR